MAASSPTAQGKNLIIGSYYIDSALAALVSQGAKAELLA